MLPHPSLLHVICSNPLAWETTKTLATCQEQLEEMCPLLLDHHQPAAAGAWLWPQEMSTQAEEL
jgi:hypothetical protein